VSPDGTVYTFKLRKDVNFHDGTQLTARDVKSSFIALIGSTKSDAKKIAPTLAIKGAADLRSGKSKELEGITVIDDFTIKFELTMKTANFLFGVSGIQLFPDRLILKDTEPATFHMSEFWQSPIGSGPFMISKRVPGDYDELIAFKDYFKGEPLIETIVIRHRDPIIAAEAGMLDRYQAKHTFQVAPLTSIEGLRGYKIDGLYKREIWTNLTRSYLQDVRIRRAIAYSINRQEICDDLLEGLARPWNSVMTPTFWANSDLPPIEYNPEKSRQLLKEARWDNTRELDFVYYYTDSQTQDFVALIQSYLTDVGIKMQPRLVERNVSVVLYEQRDFDLAYGANNGFEPDFMEKYRTGEPKAIGYSNSRVDELLAEAKYEENVLKRKALYDEVQRIFYEDMQEIPLYASDVYIIENERLVKPQDDIYSYYPANVQLEKWYFK